MNEQTDLIQYTKKRSLCRRLLPLLLAMGLLLVGCSGGTITKEENDVKITETAARSIETELYETADFSLQIPKGWTVTSGGTAMYHSIRVQDPSQPLNQMFVLLKAEGLLHSQEELVDEVVALDFFRDVPELKVPVILTEGRHDQNTPASIAHRWYDGLRAPKKQWIWFENSAHSPIHEEPERWCEEVRAALFGA